MKTNLWQTKGLRNLLETDMRVELISEPLYVVDEDEPAQAIAEELRRRGYDECGVRRAEAVHAIAGREKLATGRVGDHAESAPLTRIVAPFTPIWSCLDRLAEHRALFVLGHDGLDAIVTLSDLNKQPARLLMFGLISTIEMVLLDFVRRTHPGDTWKAKIADKRIASAAELHQKRRDKNEEIDLADCLQMCDKAAICVQTPVVMQTWALSKQQAERLFRRLQDIRDNLAHAQRPDVGKDWTDIVSALRGGHEVLNRSLVYFEASPEAQ